MSIIPNKSRNEWKLLLTDHSNVKFQNFVLQMQVDQTKHAIKNGQITMDDGIDKIHALCEKYALLVKSDIDFLFKK